MKKWIFRIIFVLLLAVFIFSAVSLFMIYKQYRVGRRAYDDAVSQFTLPAVPDDGQPLIDISDLPAGQQPEQIQAMVVEADSGKASIFPFEVDFEALKKINDEIVGWIYCPGTPINYPLLKANDNDYYLHRSYDRSYLFNGSIFVEARNQPLFLDSNTIIYGHNMRDGSMFEALENWQDPSFYETHPYILIFTPDQDYVVILFSGYTTSATSDSYQIFSGPGEELDAYLQSAVSQSDFSTSVELDPNAKYVMLSTCSYVFDNSRYVLHGMLLPTGTAGGKPIDSEQVSP